MYRLASEIELFGTLNLRLFNSKEKNNDENEIESAKETRKQLISTYKTKFQQMIETFIQIDVNAEEHLSVALYLASYYDENQSGIEFKNKHVNNKDFQKFEKEWKNVNCPDKMQGPQELNVITQLLGNNYHYYIKQCSYIEKGNTKVAKAIFEFKKMFSIPWLIAGESIIEVLSRNLRQSKKP